MKQTIERDWKPVSKGAIYCSPACGYRCTWTEYIDAKTKADALVDVLTKEIGPGWKPRVWENLGWHYCAVKGKMEIHPHNPYWVSLVVAGKQFTAEHKDPVKAVRLVTQNCYAFIQELAGCLLETLIGGE